MSHTNHERREFLKAMSGTAIGASVLGLGSPIAETAAAEDKPVSDKTTIERRVANFGVYDEWGPLKEVFVGRADTSRFPHWDDVYTIVSPFLQEAIKKHSGKLIKDVMPEFVSEYQEQLDGLAAAYKANGVKVHRPREITDIEIESDPSPAARGVWQSSPADAVWVIGRNYVECQLRVAVARKNFLWARDVFEPRVSKTPGARWLACPQSRPAKNMMEGTGPYVEGGDVILRGNGRDVLVGVDPYSTDQAGFDWLASSLADDGYKCWPVTFKMIEIHLLAHMNLIGPNLGIICREAFKGHEHTFPPFLKDYDWIEISVEDVHNGGADVVMLNPQKALVSKGQPRVADQLSKRGIEPQLVNIERATQASAGVRCMTIIVHREKA